MAVKVTVRLFAQLRERAGRSEVEVDLPEGAVVRDAIAALDDVAAGLPVVMAINREYADASAPLSAGDELASTAVVVAATGNGIATSAIIVLAAGDGVEARTGIVVATGDDIPTIPVVVARECCVCRHERTLGRIHRR